MNKRTNKIINTCDLPKIISHEKLINVTMKLGRNVDKNYQLHPISIRLLFSIYSPHEK